MIQHRGSQALFPLGYGLSYQSYGIGEPAIADFDRERQTAILHVPVTNEGGHAGRHVVQVYGSLQEGERAGERELLGFASASIPARQTVDVAISLDFSALGRWNAQERKVALETGKSASRRPRSGAIPMLRQWRSNYEYSTTDRVDGNGE